MASEALRYFEPESLRATLAEGAVHPRVEVLGERTILSARFRRIFPLSEPESYVSVQDSAGHEVGIARSLEAFEPDSRACISAALDRRYFTPQISKVSHLQQDAGMWRFVVETGRGEVEFYVRNWRDSAHEVQLNRWMITSVDGQRYEIVDVEVLDARSKALLDQLA